MNSWVRTSGAKSSPKWNFPRNINVNGRHESTQVTIIEQNNHADLFHQIVPPGRHSKSEGVKCDEFRYPFRYPVSKFTVQTIDHLNCDQNPLALLNCARIKQLPQKVPI